MVLTNERVGEGGGKNFQKISENQRSFKFCIVLVQSNDVLHAHSHIQLSVRIAKFCPFHIILFCAVIMKCSPVFYKTKTLNG